MNYIQDLNSFITEAISLKMYKENLPFDYIYDKSEGYKSWDNIFGVDVNRISIPLKSSELKLPKTVPLMEEINELFFPLGYKINSFEDYLNNKVYKIGDIKNPMKIGGLLNKTKPSLFSRYDTDTERKDWRDRINNLDKKLKIVISRHPYDLLGMSSGREWGSGTCMKLGCSEDDKVYIDILASMGQNKIEGVGSGKNKIKRDIIEGVLIAYIVNMDDNNINKPLSRLLIKPYINENDKTRIVWVASSKIYGRLVDGFKSSVNNWIDSWQDETPSGLYCLKGGLYPDGEKEFKM